MDAVRRSLLIAVSIGVVLSVGRGRAELSPDSHARADQSVVSAQQHHNSSADEAQLVQQPATNYSKRKRMELRFNEDIFTSEQLEDIEKMIYRPSEWHQKLSVHELGLKGLSAKLHGTIYNDMFLHRYDDPNELRIAGGPETDHELCLSQLQHIVQRAEKQRRERYDSKDINIYLLMDSYGRIPAGLILGHTFWTGSYSECLRSSIDIGDQGRVTTRYCIASFAHMNWPRETLYAETMVIKSAVCIPKACDSQRYKNKYELIQQLFEFHVRDVEKDQLNITSLYCLPDEESPLMIWYKSPSTLITVLAIGCWLSLLVFATIRNEQLRRQLAPGRKVGETGAQDFGMTGRTRAGSIYEGISPSTRIRMRLYRMLSIYTNLESLFNTTKTSALVEVTDKLRRKSSVNATNQLEAALNKIRNKSFVDLRILEGIKVICMIYVILSHVLMCMTLVMKNGAELTHGFRPAYYVANLMPAFSVNAFFTITGLLTAYLLLRQETGKSFMTSPTKWVAFIIYRYLRIMPMYAIVTLYTKTLAKYTGSGPMWDYATSSLSPRHTCEEESWLWTLLFGANFKTPLDHCIPSAWYLANDFQFFMVTPFFLFLLNKRPQVGKRVLQLGIAAGHFAGFLSIFLSDASDLRPVAQFMPHSFTTYCAFLVHNYTRPQYRIPAYLCGLLLGYALFDFEQSKINYFVEKTKREMTGETTSHDAELPTPGWPKALAKYGFSVSFFCILVCCGSPLIGAAVPFSKPTAKLTLALVMPTFHLLFPTAVGISIMLATTEGHINGHLNRLLSASFWKPLSRVSLCAVLINVEVCNYLVQTNEQNRYIDDKYHMGLNLLCIFWSYLLAIVLCVLFEAPIRAALNQLLTSIVRKAASKKVKEQ